MWKYELFDDDGGRWRWQLRDDGGKVVMISGESFDSRTSARRALVQARAYAGQAKLPSADGVEEVLGEVLERIAKRDEEERTRRATIAALN